MKLKNILLYESTINYLDTKCSLEQKGELIEAIIAWNKGEVYKFKTEKLEGYFEALEPNLNKLVTNYENKSNANRENGKKGGRPANMKSQTEVPTSTPKQELPKQPVANNNVEVIPTPQPKPKVTTPTKEAAMATSLEISQDDLFDGLTTEEVKEIKQPKIIAVEKGKFIKTQDELAENEVLLNNGKVITIEEDLVQFYLEFIKPFPGLFKNLKSKASEYIANDYIRNKYNEHMEYQIIKEEINGK